MEQQIEHHIIFDITQNGVVVMKFNLALTNFFTTSTSAGLGM